MKKHLEYTDEKSSKFWNIEVNETSHTVSYGKIGTNGQTKTKAFVSVEAAIKDADKLIKAKLKKGYFDVDQEEGSQKQWFERLNTKIFTIYKSAILKHPIKAFKYIQMNWTGQGFSLGLSTSARSEDHEYIADGDWHNEQNTSLESVYRALENIPYDEYDKDDDCYYEVEFEREEWPRDSSDCYELEYFLISVSLGLAYLKLEKDNDVKTYLNGMEVIKIVSVDRAMGAFTYHAPDEHIKKNVVQALLKHPKEQQLVLDLWGKEARNTGLDFLKKFERKVTAIKDLPKFTLKKAYEEAKALELHFRNDEAIEILKPVLEEALSQGEVKDPELIEQCCDVLGQASIDVRDGCKASIYWFQKGLEFIPNGHCAISLMSLYKLDVGDNNALIAFGEKHIQSINPEEDVDHTSTCYQYLGSAYVKIQNKEKALAMYQTLIDFLTKVDQTWRIDYAVEDLERISDWQKEYKMAHEILAWLKPLVPDDD